MPNQLRNGRKAPPVNRLLHNINEILTTPQPIAQPKAHGNDGRLHPAQRTEKFKNSREHQRGGRGREPRNDERFGTPPRQPQGAAPSLLQRMTRDGKPVLTSQVEQSYSRQGKRKRENTQERELHHEKKQRPNPRDHDAGAIRTELDGEVYSQVHEDKKERRRFDNTNRAMDVQKNAQITQHGRPKEQDATTLAPRGQKAALSTRMSWGPETRPQKQDQWATSENQHRSISTEERGDPNEQQPLAMTNNEKTFNKLPSPPSSKDSPPNAKRKIAEVGEPTTELTRKKHCERGPRHSTPPRPQKKQQTPQKPGREPCAEDAFASNPVVANPECVPTYKDYDDDSVPIMVSEQIQHLASPELLNDPSPQLKANAFVILKRGLNAKDLGRKPPKDANGKEMKLKGKVKVIRDVDLYLHEDGKLYVATELGLIIATDYLTLAGIPDTQRVRFDGMKPAWIRTVVARAHTRRAIVVTEEPYELKIDRNRHPKEILRDVPEGDLGLTPDVTVDVYFEDWRTGRAFGQRVDLNESGRHKYIGWFDMNHVGDYLPLCSDWEGLYTEEDLVGASAVYVPGAIPGRSALAPRPVPKPAPRESVTPLSSARTIHAPTRPMPAPVRKVPLETASKASDKPKAVTSSDTGAIQKSKTATSFPTEITKSQPKQAQAIAGEATTPTPDEQPAKTYQVEEAEAPTAKQSEEAKQNTERV